ncbi:TRAM domain-containing protein, partial [Halomonas sp. MG34]|nr:TRAM domain-containing protein [Halomonas sp. MG34]
NQVEEDVKNDRVHKLIELSDQLAKEYASEFENQVLEVIPEERVHDENNPEMLVGYTDNYLKVRFEGTHDMIGKLVRVKINQAGYPYNEGTFVRVMEDAPAVAAK